MRNIRLTIEYDGTNYNGWQRQANTKRTIQEVIEKALTQVLQKKVRLIASGRTDAGVHALAQEVNFKASTQVTLSKLRHALNSLLPKDITITKIVEGDKDFHARFNTKSKTYRYTILNQKCPSALNRHYAHFLPYKLNTKLMTQGAKFLLGAHDFRCFQASDKKLKNSVRTVKKIMISKHGNFIHIDIEADGFLYKMVRNITGTLIDIGRGKIAPSFIKEILALGNRQIAGPTAPACGLCLIKVKY